MRAILKASSFDSLPELVNEKTGSSQITFSSVSPSFTGTLIDAGGPLNLAGSIAGNLSVTDAGIILGEGTVGGVFTLFAILFFFVGCQFLALGLLGEYIGRIYVEARDRPRYMVKKVHHRRGDSLGV